MWYKVASVDDRVSHSLVRVIDTDFGTDAPPCALLGARLHLCEMLQIIFHAVFPVLGGNSVEPLLTHLLTLISHVIVWH